ARGGAMGGGGSPYRARPSRLGRSPRSLHASLMARLDRLGSAKAIAQIGAVIGREFPHSLLAAVARTSHPDLETDLERLISAGLLFRHGIPHNAVYLFKRWCRMRPMARCCAPLGSNSTSEL